MAKGKKPPHGGGGGGSNTIPAPTGLIASLTPENRVYIQWNPVVGASSYWIRRSVDGVEYVPAIIQSTSYTDGSVSSGTTYVYKIAAVVNSVLGPDSSPVTIATN